MASVGFEDLRLLRCCYTWSDEDEDEDEDEDDEEAGTLLGRRRSSAKLEKRPLGLRACEG